MSSKDQKSNVAGDFKTKVHELVAQIPKGKVMTYGQLAALAGSPRAARIVGGVAHFGDPDLPWQRVVNKQGGVAKGYPGGREVHRGVLEAEGYEFKDEFNLENVNEILFWPED